LGIARGKLTVASILCIVYCGCFYDFLRFSCNVNFMRRPQKLTPALPSASIPDSGLICTNDLIGSARLGIKPIFPISRMMMETAIRDRRLPEPLKLNSTFVVWEARVIKAFVAQLEQETPVLAATEGVGA
jgi:hypothetical protein